MRHMGKAAWLGMRLVCPACEKGKIGRGFGIAEECPACGALLQPNEGDFIGAMVVAYSVTAVLVAMGIFLVAWLTNLDFVGHLILWSIVSTAFMLFTYRNMKGIWVGILHGMVGLEHS